jgi:hypothetical protein
VKVAARPSSGRDCRPRLRRCRLLAALLSALVVAAAPAPAAPALIRRCVEAYGGEAALARAARAVHQGTVTSLLHPGVTGRIGRAYHRPGKLRVEVDFGGEGEVRILDGGRGWRQGQEVSGMHLASMILQAARLDLPSLLSAWQDRVEDRGGMELDGKTLRVLAIRVAPGLVVEADLDPATGRILRSRGTSTGGPNPLEFTTTFSDFRTVDGLLVPFHETNWANGRTTGETVLERVELPRELPDELFRP